MRGIGFNFQGSIVFIVKYTFSGNNTSDLISSFICLINAATHILSGCHQESWLSETSLANLNTLGLGIVAAAEIMQQTTPQIRITANIGSMLFGTSCALTAAYTHHKMTTGLGK